MKTSSLDCLPCLLRQAADAIRRSTDVEERRILAMREALLAASALDFTATPPELSRELQAVIRRSTGCADPYADAKHAFTALANRLLPALKERVRAAPDPFEAAVKLAIVGNVIDLGVKSGLGLDEVEQAVDSAFGEPLHGDVEALRGATASARRILYLADNAGEIVFDTVLLGQLPRGRVTVAVRGAPTLNDAILEDAIAAGIPALASLIDNGSSTPGTALDTCSAGFLRHFAAADLIISKGQGNYETLSDVAAPIAFLFRVKCPIVATQCGHPVGAHVVCR